MASYLSFVILTLTLTITISATISSARVIPAEPVSVMLDAYGNPVLFLREKRAPIRQPIIPQRAMMFTGYYRPARRSYDSNQGAAGVFAQGNAVSGGSYLSGIPHLRKGPQPIEEPEISSAQAEAAPAPAPEPEINHQTYDQEDQHDFQDQNQNSPTIPEGQHETPISDPEPLPYDIDAPAPSSGVENHEGQDPVEEEVEGPAVSSRPVPPAKKGKKRPVFDEDQEDDEDEIEDEEPYVPFLPANQGNKRRQGARIPNYNNLFPMMFSFPGLSTRAGARPGSSPGVITAIANSYSTGKGGVASSVATAYGGSPNGKKARRAPAAEE